MYIRFQGADARHVASNYHGVTPGPTLAEKVLAATVVKQELGWQQSSLELRHDLHLAAQDLGLQIQKVVNHLPPSLSRHSLAFPRTIESID